MSGVTYERPMRASLIVRLENGDEWEASAQDLDRFGYGRRLSIYTRTAQMLAEGLGLSHFDELTDHPRPNLVRYLIECGVMYRHSPWADENGEPWPRDEDDDEPPFMEQLRAAFVTQDGEP